MAARYAQVLASPTREVRIFPRSASPCHPYTSWVSSQVGGVLRPVVLDGLQLGKRKECPVNWMEAAPQALPIASPEETQAITQRTTRTAFLPGRGQCRRRRPFAAATSSRNQVGAVFNANVTQNPHVGLVDWQFHYRDPNAKGKGNVDCTDARNPRRNDAATCGASWSQTLRDP